MLGSKAHAEGLKAAGARVEAVLNNDIVGASVGPDGVKRDKYIRVFSPCPKGSTPRRATWRATPPRWRRCTSRRSK